MLFKLTPEVFLEHIAVPCYDWLRIPRNKDFTAYENALQYVGGMHRTQVHNCDRILRVLLRLQGNSSQVISYLYDQDPSTISRDIIHTAAVMCHALKHIISPIEPGSPEYFAKKGSNTFKYFPNALYAIDCTKVMCR